MLCNIGLKIILRLKCIFFTTTRWEAMQMTRYHVIKKVSKIITTFSWILAHNVKLSPKFYMLSLPFKTKFINGQLNY